MSMLKVLLHGQEISQLQLEPGNEYLIGRGSDCSLKLPSEKGISRQHLRLIEQNGNWTVELISKTGSLIFDGEEASAIELMGKCRFSVPPFEFIFEASSLVNEVADESLSDEPETPKDMVSDPSEPSLNMDLPESEPKFEPEPDIDPIEDTMNATAAGIVNLVPVLKVENTQSGETYSLKLDGNLWTAGRSPENEIHIDDSAVSRRHFEIALVGRTYAIKDLGSSNGTQLNGQSLEPNEIYEISSGDKISIRHLSLQFEIRDENYEEKLAGIKEIALLDNQPGVMPGADPMQAAMEVYTGPAVEKLTAESGGNFLANPKVKKALMIGAPLLLIFALFFSDDSSKDSSSESPAAEEQVTSPEDLAEAKHLLEVAKGHYMNGNYSFCITQLEKLHNTLPSYEDSKEVEKFCRQAIELEKEQADELAKEQAKQEALAKIRSIIDNCEADMTEQTTSTELRICLDPAFELNPEEPRALQLLTDLELKEQQVQSAAAQQQAAAARTRAGKNVFNKAVNLEKSGKLKSARSEYLSFLRGNYGLSSEETQARRSVASINKKLEAIVLKSVQECEQALEQKKYKDALRACNEALKIDSSNGKAKSSLEQVQRKIKIDMKKLWDSSVLEENYGNLEAAKAKWKEIVDKSYSGESYYRKARNKLKSYGVE